MAQQRFIAFLEEMAAQLSSEQPPDPQAIRLAVQIALKQELQAEEGPCPAQSAPSADHLPPSNSLAYEVARAWRDKTLSKIDLPDSFLEVANSPDHRFLADPSFVLEGLHSLSGPELTDFRTRLRQLVRASSLPKCKG